jgi:hypothetical protein
VSDEYWKLRCEERDCEIAKLKEKNKSILAVIDKDTAYLAKLNIEIAKLKAELFAIKAYCWGKVGETPKTPDQVAVAVFNTIEHGAAIQGQENG